MLRRMQRKKLISYDKKTGVLLSKKGKQKAIETIRKHRLWEVFLHEKLGFRWDEIHNIAEQLEHIQSEELVKRLDEFLDFPKFDPHGDPIPQANGKLNPIEGFPLSKGKLKTELIVVGVKNNQDSFLKFLNSAKIKLGSKIKIISIEDFDQSLQVILDQKINMNLSKKVSDNILVRLN
jgi:DtxR family Mn-dependent transcriptional regulator